MNKDKKYWYEHDDEAAKEELAMCWRVYRVVETHSDGKEAQSEEIAKTYEESDAIEITTALNNMFLISQ